MFFLSGSSDLSQSFSIALRGLTRLEKLVLPRSRDDNFECLKGIAIGGGASLTALDIQKSKRLCPWAAAMLASGLPNLTSLDLSHVEVMPSEAVAHVCSIKSLRDLKLAGADFRQPLHV